MSAKAVSLRVACDRLGLGYRTGQRLIADGKFPIPYLQRHSGTAHYRFSEYDIESYLQDNSTADVRRRQASEHPRKLRAASGPLARAHSSVSTAAVANTGTSTSDRRHQGVQ